MNVYARMRRPSFVRRRANLVSRIRNWPAYSFWKLKRLLRLGSGAQQRLVTRGKRIRFLVPESSLRAFKDVFMRDVYSLRGVFQSLPPNATIVDVGANVGLFTVAAAECADNPTILAVEPLPANLRMLKQNLAIIPPRIATVRCLDAALCGKSRPAITLHHAPDAFPSGLASTEPGFAPDNTSSVSVRAVTLGALMRGFKVERIDLLKLDCAGAELEIVEHTPRDVLRRVHRIVLKVYDASTAAAPVDRMCDMLRANGFEPLSARIDKSTFVVWADR